MAPSLLGFRGSQPNELQKRCWNSHSIRRANPVSVALPILAAYCWFCSHFSTSVSLADASPMNRGTSSAWLVALRSSFCSPGVFRAQWFPAKTMALLPPSRRGHGLFQARSSLCLPTLFLHELYAQMGVRMHICVYLLLLHTPKGVCSTCLIVLWT